MENFENKYAMYFTKESHIEGDTEMKGAIKLIICVLVSAGISNAQVKEESLFSKSDEISPLDNAIAGSEGIIENSTTRHNGSLKCGNKCNQHSLSELQQSAMRDGCIGTFMRDANQECAGPTIELDYGMGCSENTIDDFMYFIPLVSPALVDSRTSLENKQTARITSFKSECRKGRFRVVCEFEIIGTGYLLNKYDPESMIERYSKNKRGKTLKKVIDYIKIQGQGKGWVEVIGKIVNGKNIVDEIEINFHENSKDLLSIGLYDVNFTGDRYDCSGRFNQTVVRVNTLCFKRAGGTPKMEVKISSVAKANQCRGLFGGLKGTFVNMFMDAAPEIDATGNEVMLDFGSALLNQKRQFTFPRARNLMNDNSERIPSYGKDQSVKSGSRNS